MTGWQHVHERPIVNSGDERLPDEMALLKLGRTGDASALERLLAPHEKPLKILCLGMLGHTDDAEDAVQETFYRALQNLSRFNGNAVFGTWLYRIAINVCLGWRRSRKPEQFLHDETMDSRSHTPSPETDVINRLGALSALSQLLPRHRAIILLRELEGRSIPEIAETMQWNEKKVRNELFKARRVLADWQRTEAEAVDKPQQGVK
jgi:RNA polymerase sigma-70 factor (ECF subfamily)